MDAPGYQADLGQVFQNQTLAFFGMIARLIFL
jgi:hypothetical protein